MTQADPSIGNVLDRLYTVIQERASDDPAASYTASLLAAGRERCAKKFGEEAIETVIAGTQGAREELTAEAADTLYHLLVLLAANGVTPGNVAAELARREGTSGHAEKAARG